MKTPFVHIAFIGALLLGEAPAHSQEKAPPNIILILADDLGTLDLNSYGSTDLETPNLDRLATNGVRFTQFYAVAPVCSPSRAGLLTGKTNLGAGLVGNVQIPEFDRDGKSGLPSSQLTIAEVLKRSGYYTALVGKWHLGHAADKVPNAQGFDYFFGHQRGCIDNYSHYFYWAGPNKHDLFRNDEEVHYPGEYFAELMVNEIDEIVTADRTSPFFIYWAINMPHYPYQGSQRWAEHYQSMPSPRREYAAFVSTMDEYIGKVLDKLAETGKDKNTIIVFQSDHGHSFEERAFHGGGNAGPYRGGKFSMFEGGIRVPAIIYYPPSIPSNQVRDQMVSGMDWFPTLATMAGAEFNPAAVEGKNLMPVLLNPNAPSPHQELHWQTGSFDDSKVSWAVRKDNWKLMGNPVDPSNNQKFAERDRLFLVNLENDIGEQTNLASSFPEKFEELLLLHQQWLQKKRRSPNGENGDLY